MLRGSDNLNGAPQAILDDGLVDQKQDFGRALIELGFIPVGNIDPPANHPGTQSPANAPRSEGLQVLTSHDALMFGVVDTSTPDPVICLQTMLENGVLIETTMRPARAQQVAQTGWYNSAQFAWLVRLVAGDPPLWPRGNWPPASCYVELVDTRDARRLLDHHCARITEFQERYGISAPAHNTLQVYQAIQLRLDQVTAYRNTWSTVLNVSILLMLLAGIFLIPRSGSLMDILFALYAGALAVLAMGLANRVVLPELGPRAAPLKTLLKKLKAKSAA